ncbi:uncharacterized protein LOC144446573 [Glandiceps talaboti]
MAAGYNIDNVKTNLDNLMKKLTDNPRYKNGIPRPITFLYHVTNQDNKILAINGGGILTANVCKAASHSPCGPIVRYPPRAGVFFCCTLGDEQGNLPFTSPYGTERINIPVHHFSIGQLYHLFFDSYRININYIMYIYLVLVNRYDAANLQYCQNNLLPLDGTNNGIFKIVQTATGPQVRVYHKGRCIWVEIFVMGNVNILLPGAVWDQVNSQQQLNLV